MLVLTAHKNDNIQCDAWFCPDLSSCNW